MKRLGARSTAEEALQGVVLTGKSAIVTGGNSGLGVETCRVLALAGARVTLAVRDVQSGEAVAAALRAALPTNAGSLSVSELDLTNLPSIHRFLERHGKETLDLLINNAGVMATPLGVTSLGIETQLGTNHVGHFALTLGLLPALSLAPAARVVNLSSALHKRGRGARLLETLEQDPRYERRPYRPFSAYGDSKLANVLFAQALARRLPPNVLAFSLHPGVIPTPLSRSMGLAGVFIRAVGRVVMKTVQQGAATSIYAATAPELAESTGAYLADCEIATPSAQARDERLSEQVWVATERWVRA